MFGHWTEENTIKQHKPGNKVSTLNVVSPFKMLTFRQRLTYDRIENLIDFIFQCKMCSLSGLVVKDGTVGLCEHCYWHQACHPVVFSPASNHYPSSSHLSLLMFSHTVACMQQILISYFCAANIGVSHPVYNG